MKELKALIKIELRSTLLMSIYFLVVNLCGLAACKIAMDKNYVNQLRYGIGWYIAQPNGEYIYPVLVGTYCFTLGGIILLVYFQFVKDKSLEVGRFLKALPYTNRQRGFVKIGMGILSYTLPFLILIGGMLLLHGSFVGQMQEIYNVFMNQEVIERIIHINELLKMFLLMYMTFIAVYLFLMLVQYVANNNLGSIIMSILTLIAPLFIVLSGSEIYSFFRRMHRLRNLIIEFLFVPGYPLTLEGGSFALDRQNQEQAHFIGYQEINHYGLKVVGLILFIGLCLIFIHLLIKHTKMEDSDKLFNHGLAKWIFIIGVTVCSGLLLADMGLLFILPLFMDEYFVMTQVLILIGALIGFVIAYKIGRIGSYKREEK
ncbi:hypothetical protein CS063_07550 [Sporanaerobium hydrogeniformans]|uniref:Uncharacterized protein n=1 Tax=Sporanaerobium hydrogeniformans TaxID=3072179 RepID=A0AC61DDH1_9FIRM|nr:hypothetical protein [Sporanaerobium hydrogeniformans]PHV70870.1 hypothetical protein CS063_07550 [Sporanaerobium hydrogeniformans]